MAARAIWKGVIKVAGSSLPVKLYSAVQDRDVHFHILEKRTHSRVKQRLMDPETEEEVPSEQLRKGFEVEAGTFVLLDEDELSTLEPEASREIEITRFVKTDAINHQWYERPYYLGPDDGAGNYFALARAMERRNCEGVARWVMRKKAYLGALRPAGGYLMLFTLRHAEEVLSAKELPSPSGKSLDSKEREIARQLVAALEGEFRPEEFHEEYRERVMKLIEAKAHGQKPRLRLVKTKAKEGELSDLLAASLKAAKSKEKAAA
jgi:DNA end-binding protein Ku